MKTGTTSLYEYMRGHPQIFMPATKEVNFFNPLRNWRLGVEWYEEQFRDASDDVLAIGEASTSYTKFPWVRDVPERVSSVLGDVRLIYLVRDPIERARSHYVHNLSTGKERRPIEKAFERDPMYLNISRYALQVDQYLEYFSRESLLIVESRDLLMDRRATLARIFGFLGVDQGWTPPTIDQEFLRSSQKRMRSPLLRRIRQIPRIRTLAVYVPGPIKRAKHTLTDELPTQELDLARGVMSQDVEQWLREALVEDVRRLRPYLGDGFDGWGIA
jgi:hypothetical protein